MVVEANRRQPPKCSGHSNARYRGNPASRARPCPGAIPVPAPCDAAREKPVAAWAADDPRPVTRAPRP